MSADQDHIDDLKQRIKSERLQLNQLEAKALRIQKRREDCAGRIAFYERTLRLFLGEESSS